MFNHISKIFYARLCDLRAALVLCLVLILPLPAMASEENERSDIKAEVLTALSSRDYGRLEDLSNRYASPAERTSSGLWKQTMLFFAFVELQHFDYRADDLWKELNEAAMGWTRAYPQSSGAHVAVALVHYAHGWAYRGPGWASTVPHENWKPYREYLVKAQDYLRNEASFASKDPNYQNLMLVILNELQAPEEEFQKLAGQAMTTNPGFYQTYFTIMNHYLPKWGGDAKAVEDFARAAVKYTKETDGDGMYARIYWAASQSQFGAELFTRSEANWSDMKRGITDVLARYDDAWNVNHFAKFACLANDREMTHELMAKIGSNPLPAAWQDVSFAKCQNWAAAAQ
jgi:hypothetical protein